jgi:hypothetical protein
LETTLEVAQTQGWRKRTKKAEVIAMMNRAKGATLTEIMKVTGCKRIPSVVR